MENQGEPAKKDSGYLARPAPPFLSPLQLVGSLDESHLKGPLLVLICLLSSCDSIVTTGDLNLVRI